MSEDDDLNWRERFPNAELVVRGEGGAVYSAAGEDGAWWLITDERAIADEGLSPVRLERFDDQTEWWQAIVEKQGVRTRVLSEQLLRLQLPAIAEGLERLAADRGLAKVNERDHLQPQSVQVLRRAAEAHRPPLIVSSAYKLAYPSHWPRVGDVDIVLRTADGPQPAFLELKCGSDMNALGPCAWDLLKCALAVRMGTTAGAYLLAATTEMMWERPLRGAEFFMPGEWETEAVREAYADWFRSYEKRGDPQPGLLPARGSTEFLGEAAFEVGGTRWLLRLTCVDVERHGWFTWAPLLEG